MRSFLSMITCQWGACLHFYTLRFATVDLELHAMSQVVRNQYMMSRGESVKKCKCFLHFHRTSSFAVLAIYLLVDMLLVTTVTRYQGNSPVLERACHHHVSHGDLVVNLGFFGSNNSINKVLLLIIFFLFL